MRGTSTCSRAGCVELVSMDFTQSALGWGGGSPWRDYMQVCLNGHVINDEVRESPEQPAWCPEDGQPTISACPSCGKPIFGKTHYPEGLSFAGIITDAPQYCEHEDCGKAFPVGRVTPPRKLRPFALTRP